jgi:hypothetical protein
LSYDNSVGELGSSLAENSQDLSIEALAKAAPQPYTPGKISKSMINKLMGRSLAPGLGLSDIKV